MGYSVYWTNNGEHADLAHLPRAEWDRFREDILAALPDDTEVIDGDDKGYRDGDPFFGILDRDQAVTFPESGDVRINIDADAIRGLVMIAGLMRPDAPEVVLFWDGEENEDLGQLRVRPGVVEYAPLVATYPVAATYAGGPAGIAELDSEQAAQEQRANEWREKYEREKAAAVDRPHAAECSYALAPGAECDCGRADALARYGLVGA